MHHRLKLFEPNFQPVVDGKKRHDVRLDDREHKYAVGDTVTLCEGSLSDGVFVETGRQVSAMISWVDSYGVHDGYVALSYAKVGMVIVEGAV